MAGVPGTNPGFVNYIGGAAQGGGPQLPPGQTALSQALPNGLPAYQPVPDSASFLAMLASLQGQPTLQPALAGIAGTPAAGTSGGASTPAPGAAGAPGAPGAVPVAPWITGNVGPNDAYGGGFNTPQFAAALAAQHAQANAAAQQSQSSLANPVNPWAGNPGPLGRLQWTGFSQGASNPFSGQVGGRLANTSPQTAPPGWPTNPNGTTPVPPAGSPGAPPQSTWSLSDQLLGHGAGIVPQHPVDNGAGPPLPQSPWSHLANHLRNPNGSTPVQPATAV